MNKKSETSSAEKMREETRQKMKELERQVLERYWSIDGFKDAIAFFDAGGFEESLISMQTRFPKMPSSQCCAIVRREASAMISTATKKAYELSLLADKNYFSDVAIFKFVSQALAPAYDYLSIDERERLAKEIMFIASDKKYLISKYAFTQCEIEELKAWADLTEESIKNYKDDLAKLLRRQKKINGLKDDKTLSKNLLRWFRRNYCKDAIQTPTAKKPVPPKTSSIAVDKTAGALQSLSRQESIKGGAQKKELKKKSRKPVKENGNKKSIMIPMTFFTEGGKDDKKNSCATIYASITSQDLDLMALVDALYTSNSKPGEAYTLELDDLIRIYKGRMTAPGQRIYTPTQAERNYYIAALDKCFGTRLVLEIKQEYENILSEDQKRRMLEAFPNMRDLSDYKIRGHLLYGKIEEGKSRNGKMVSLITIFAKSEYMAYIMARDGYITYPYQIRQIILKDERGQTIKEPEYYYNFLPEILRRITLMQQGKDIYWGSSKHIISIAEDNLSQNSGMNIYQLCGVASPSEASNGDQAKKYKIMQRYRKTIEMILNNLVAHGYIKAWEPYRSKVEKTRRITGYKIYLADKDASNVIQLIGDARQQKKQRKARARRKKAASNTRI